MNNFSTVVTGQACSKVVRASGVKSIRVNFTLKDISVSEAFHSVLACRVDLSRHSLKRRRKLAAFALARTKRPAFAQVTARQLFLTQIRFGGGKGIRTPDLLIANETLYQLSYTPIYQ